MSKYFQVSTEIQHCTKEESEAIHNSNMKLHNEAWVSRGTLAKKAIEKEVSLKHVYGKVVIKIDMESKNTHTFSDGTVIRRERKYNNFNFREVNPSNAIVISAENIPAGAEILVDYTSIHDSNRIFDYESGSLDINFYSVKEEECYAWREGKGEWKPTTNCEFGLRIYKPYEGVIKGVEPTFIKDILYVTTGNLKGNVVNTLKGCDYQIVFQNDEGKEGALIRFKHSEDEGFDREEIICINHELTEKVKKGKLYIGYTPSDAKPLNIFK